MLERIHIKNFRSCRDVEFQVSEGVCALIGKNGVGKTNILKAVDWLASSVATPGGVKLSPWDSPDTGLGTSVGLDCRLQNKLYRYELEYCFPYPQNGEKVGLTEKLDVRESNGPVREILGRRANEVRIPGSEAIQLGLYTPAIAALQAIFPESDPLQRDLNPLLDCLRHLNCYTLAVKEDEPGYVSMTDYQNWLSKYESDGESTDSVSLRSIYMKINQQKEFDHLLALIGPNGLNLISTFDITPLEMTRPILENTPISSRTTGVVLSLRPSESMGGHGKELPFSELSMGTRRIIRLITSLLFDKCSVMLVEHPEDSIHPGMLRKLIDVFRTYSYDSSPYSSQIIFTTHSTEVLNILKPEEVRFVTAEGGETRVRQLSAEELDRAKWFLDNEGALSQFLESIDE